MSISEDNQNQMAELSGKIASDANNNEYEGTPNLPAPLAPSVSQSEDGSQPPAEHHHHNDSNSDPEKNSKLFVGFGNAGFGEQALEHFFSKYGTVKEVIIKRDVVTGKQRGFAFITMSSPEEAVKIMDVRPDNIDGRSVDIKMAKSRPISKKVFVGGIDPNLSEEAIANHFSVYGDINDIELPMDRINQKRREFCFIIFETEEAANLASATPRQMIYKRMCDVKKATPQPIAQQQKRQQQNLHQSFNNSQQSNYHPLNQSRGSRYYSYSPSSVKSGPSSYRGYRSNSRSDSHRNSFSGRRSVDSQHGGGGNGGHHEQFGNQHGYNRKNGPPHRQSDRSSSRPGTAGGQYQSNASNSGQSGHHQAKIYNGHHHNNKPQQQQQHLQQQQQPHQSQQPMSNQQQQYYDQSAHQAYYSYGMPYNDYYQQPYSQPQTHANLAGNQFQMQPLSQPDYYNQAAYNFYQQQTQQQQSALQQPYNPSAMNACYTNYQAANATVDGAAALAPAGQQQLPIGQSASANPGDYQPLDERFLYQDQKQFENNLINTAAYDKFGGSQDEINYQQMVNHNNLLSVQFQGSLQQC